MEACTYCRIKLLKCDRDVPRCCRCSTLGQECVYDKSGYSLPETLQNVNASPEISENPQLEVLGERAEPTSGDPTFRYHTTEYQYLDSVAEAGEEP